MPSLHTLNTATDDPINLTRCLERMLPDDALLLLENGVYWLLPAHAQRLPHDLKLYALEADVLARGLDVGKAQCVNDAGFVQLTLTYDKVISWF